MIKKFINKKNLKSLLNKCLKLKSKFYNFNNISQIIRRAEDRIYYFQEPKSKNIFYAPTFCQLNAMFREIVLRRKFYQNLNKTLFKVEGRIILDIGANIGYYSLACAKFCPNIEIISFEPSVKNIGFAGINLRNYENVSLYNFGLSNSFGRFNLKIPDYASSRKGENALNTGLFSAIGNETKNGARFLKLDKFSDLINLQKTNIGWIKIDVEGFELNVLKGMEEILLEGTSFLEIEININTLNLAGISFREILDFLDRFKYFAMRNNEKNFFNSIDSFAVMDVVFSKEKYCEIAMRNFNLIKFSSEECEYWINHYE